MVFPNGRVIEEHNTSPLKNISPAGSFMLAFANITDNSSRIQTPERRSEGGV
jgi:hypothetical protein